ncbi:MAG TPA: VanW family protein, partial [Polyangiaceae bacterium]|nr:VanW family protein [Polyangiaceae bacterium]
GSALLRPVRWAVGFFASPIEVSPVVRVVERQRWLAALNAAATRCLTPAFAGALAITEGRVTPVYPRPGQRLDADGAERTVLRALESGTSPVRLSPIAQQPPWSRTQVEQAVRLAASLAVNIRLYDLESERKLELSANEVAGLLRLAPGVPASHEPEVRVDQHKLQEWLSGPGRALEREPHSASFVIGEADEVHVLPSEPEVKVDTAALADAILVAAASTQGWGVLPLRRRGEPTLSTEAALALGVRGLVSTFTTRHPCCERRVDNIHRIADLLDGLLVRPGETLSVNAVVGARTTSNGFVQAPAIEEGEMVESVGGGISQFATTLFNALFYGGYDIVERQPHTYWFPRYPMGHEATLSYPKPDLVFRNDTSAGLLIDTQYTGTRITVRLFGDNGGRKVRAEVSPRQNVVQPPAELVPSADLPPDKERVQEAGMVGWSVLVGRVISYPDGTQKEERRKVTYRPRTRRVLVHPCRVPRGEKGHTGESCPTPEESPDPSLSPDTSAPEGASQ